MFKQIDYPFDNSQHNAINTEEIKFIKREDTYNIYEFKVDNETFKLKNDCSWFYLYCNEKRIQSSSFYYRDLKTCDATLITGPRKGLKCKNPATDYGRCGKHRRGINHFLGNITKAVHKNYIQLSIGGLKITLRIDNPEKVDKRDNNIFFKFI